MDHLFEKITENTVRFNLGDEETWRELYEPFYEEHSIDVHVIRDERYGPAERNRLDVFVPPNEQVGKPVLLYVHGGGFFSGDKGWSSKCWANIGNFFARHGIITVVINHQLVPHVQYPGGPDDIQLVREWIYHKIASQKYGSGNADKVVLFGHSSGGAHIASNLYAAGDPNRASTSADEVFPPVAGVMYFSTPFWFDRTRPIRQRTLRQYYGSDAEEVWGPISPLGLFERIPDSSPLLDANKIPVYIGTVKWEVKEAADAAIAFFNAYRARSRPAGTLPFFHVLDKHNHLSNILSIGTEDVSQSRLILEFINSCVAKVDSRGKQRL